MKKKILIVNFIVLYFLCISCQTGYWINGSCRPKNPKFKIQKIPFVKTDKLVFNKIYKSNYIAIGYGFYPDGRLIIVETDNTLFKIKKFIPENWNYSHCIGYWRINGEKIEIEYFVCSDTGFYVRKRGKIKGDKIIFYKKLYKPFRKLIREEHCVLTKKSFK